MNATRPLLLAALLSLPAAAAAAPAAPLAPAPADAESFTIVSAAGVHGHSYRWQGADGARMGRENLNLRGQLFDLESTSRLGSDHMLAHLQVRGTTPRGDAAERFDVQGGRASWQSAVDQGSAAYTSARMYDAFGGPADLNATLYETLVAAPRRTLSLLPSGEVHAEPVGTATVGTGAARQTLALYAVSGLDFVPTPVWLTSQGRFFGAGEALFWVRSGYEADVPALLRAQEAALAQGSREVARTLGHAGAGTVAFTHVRAFIDGTRFVEDETVIVRDAKISAVGAAAGTAVPDGAKVIDGHGQTLVPGLWDSHQHVHADATGPLLLSLGITSVRDPGNVNAFTLSRAQRRARGELLSPHVYPSLLIDGKGPNAAQMASVATSEAEAVGLVRSAKEQGFTAIKIYGSFNPAWVAATTAEAHRLGLHVHGHLPAGMRSLEAIDAGYDELTHIYFVIMQAMPPEVVAHSNGIARVLGPARYAKDVDLAAEPMKTLIATMAQRHIVSDPTLVVVEGLLVPGKGELAPSYRPYQGALPAVIERGYRQGALAVPSDLTQEDFRRAFVKLRDLVGAMHRAGVPIVAGTDGSGLELVRELELYVDAGFTPAEALASATVVPARVMGVAARTGTIAAGQAADLALVKGDPSQRIGDLRHTSLVMVDGELLDPAALRAAGGLAAGAAH
jgi:imidazolonepropionase-like amidohydrolase